MKHLKTIKIKELKGKETIARADDIFYWIDSDFEKWETDKKGVKTAEMELAVCEMTENQTFAQIFTKPEEMSLSQGQIIEFCKNNKEDLRKEGYSTLFLYKVDSKFFVAFVDVHSGGLYVDVREFSSGGVWGGGNRRRFVIPQLALGNLDSGTLNFSPSDYLQKAIEEVKSAGYKVIKEM